MKDRVAVLMFNVMRRCAVCGCDDSTEIKVGGTLLDRLQATLT